MLIPKVDLTQSGKIFDKPLLTFSIRPSIFKAFAIALPKSTIAPIILSITSKTSLNKFLINVKIPPMTLNAPLLAVVKPSQTTTHAFFKASVSPVNTAIKAPKSNCIDPIRASSAPPIILNTPTITVTRPLRSSPPVIMALNTVSHNCHNCFNPLVRCFMIFE